MCFAKHADLFESLGVDANNGIGDAYAKIADLPQEQREAVEAGSRSGLPEASGAGDGQLRQRYYQPARTQ